MKNKNSRKNLYIPPCTINFGEKMKGCSGCAVNIACAVIFASLGVFFLVDGFNSQALDAPIAAFIAYVVGFIFLGAAKMCKQQCNCKKTSKPRNRKRRR